MAALSCIHRGYARTDRRTPASVRWSLIGEMAAAPWASDYRLPKQVHAHSDLLTHVSGYGEAPWVISHGGCVRVTTRSIASVSPVLQPDSRVPYDLCRGHGRVCLADVFRPLHPRHCIATFEIRIEVGGYLYSVFCLLRRRFCIVASVVKYIAEHNVRHCNPDLCFVGICTETNLACLPRGSVTILRGTTGCDRSDGLTLRDAEPLILVGGQCEGVEVQRL